MSDVIVLNADLTYHQTVHWQDAVCMMLKGVAEPLVQGTRVIRSVSIEVIVPKVLRLVKYIRVGRKTIMPFKKSVVYLRDDYVCQYCGRKLDRGECTLDHVIPKVRGGKSSYVNCVTACKSCNTKKGDKTTIKPVVMPKGITVYDYIRMRSEDAAKLLNDIGTI